MISDSRAARVLRALAPHQRAFVELAAPADRPARMALLAPAGYGKTVAVAATIRQILATQPTARVLIVAPAPLTRWYKASLEEAPELAPLLVDPPQYRHMELSAGKKGNPWAEGRLLLTSPELLLVDRRISDVTAASWDLVVMEDWQFLDRRHRQTLLENLWQAPNVKSFLIETAEIDAGDALTPDAVIINWGTLRQYMPPPTAPLTCTLHEFQLTEPEREVVRVLEAIVRSGNLVGGRSAHIGRLLMRRLHSSLFALEELINRMVAAGEEWDFAEEEDGIDSSYMRSNADSGIRSVPEYRLRDLLPLFEKIERDTKAGVLERLLREAPMNSTRRYVFAEYADTAEYIERYLVARGFNAISLTTRSQDGVRQRMLEVGSSPPGTIYVVSWLAMRGFEFPTADTVVHYDTPDDPNRLALIMSRCLTETEGEPIDSHFLVASDSPTGDKTAETVAAWGAEVRHRRWETLA
jgi:hypothetical protein